LRERTPKRAELFPESLRGSFRMTTPSGSFPGSQRALPSECFLGSQRELKSEFFRESLSE
jgi:hypothetical protein